MGSDAVGRICYTDEGFVHVHIMFADRTPHVDPDTQAGTDEENIRSHTSHISYSGRYHVEGAQVIHDVTLSSFPNWAPSKQVRDMRFEGNQLVLSTSPMAWGGRQIGHRLTWARAAT